MRRTKIIATIGPASDSPEMIQKLLDAGMNVARLNFSHGSYAYFTQVIERIRNVSPEIAIMLDTQGPEIRTTACMQGQVSLEQGQMIRLKKGHDACTKDAIFINYSHIDKLEVGNRLFFDDGLIEAEVTCNDDQGCILRFLNSGILGSKKSVSIHGHSVEIPFLSEKDLNDLRFGIENNLDFIAASFVREKKDVLSIKALLEEHGSRMEIIAKIEHWSAVHNIEEIVDVSDGIMVARGDLGVEVSLEKVPEIQRKIIHMCNLIGRPVIVATQMLESMRLNPRPTRAEVNDVAQAIIQGADAIMLSGETASGKYPVESVAMMAKIAEEYDVLVKNHFEDSLLSKEGLHTNEVTLFVTKAAYIASEALDVKAILTPTESGYTAKKVARFRPKCPILAITRDMTVLRQLQLCWGVIPFFEPKIYHNLGKYIKDLVMIGVRRGFLHEGDKVVITAGHKLHRKWTTNLLEIYYVTDVLQKMDTNENSQPHLKQ